MSVTPVAKPQQASPSPQQPIPEARTTAVPSAPLAGDRIERSFTSKTSAAARHGFGAGLLADASAEAGAMAGLGATASAGAGLFYDGARSVHPGAFASAGAFAGGGSHVAKSSNSADPVGVIGAFAGVGIGAFVTNATSARQLDGIAQTYSVNLGIGPLKLSVQMGAADGTYVGAFSVGPGIGVDAARYPTNTVAAPR